MDIRAITIDFWYTLYRHEIRRSERIRIREQLLLRRCRELGLADPEALSQTFFRYVDRLVKRRWKKGLSSSRDEIIREASDFYDAKYATKAIGEMLDEIDVTYEGPLKPDIYPGAKEFLKWASQRWPVYLICDTFMVKGKVLDSAMRTDDVLGHFKGRLYSDILGARKPGSLAIERVTENEKINPNQIIHIGDLLTLDFAMARRAGSHFILIKHGDRGKRAYKRPKSPLFLGDAASFHGIRRMLEGIAG